MYNKSYASNYVDNVFKFVWMRRINELSSDHSLIEMHF